MIPVAIIFLCLVLMPMRSHRVRRAALLIVIGLAISVLAR